MNLRNILKDKILNNPLVLKKYINTGYVILNYLLIPPREVIKHLAFIKSLNPTIDYNTNELESIFNYLHSEGYENIENTNKMWKELQETNKIAINHNIDKNVKSVLHERESSKKQATNSIKKNKVNKKVNGK